MSNRKLVAGNWKMHTDRSEAIKLTTEIIRLSKMSDVEILLAPPHCLIPLVGNLIADLPYIELAAQNISEHKSGAYTGEVSAHMLHSLGVSYVILGHSERRKYFGETDQIILSKIRRAISTELKVIYCCGEGLEDRNTAIQNKIIEAQIQSSVLQLTPDQMQDIVIAYEPIWAIGTGVTARPDQAQQMHAFIRSILADHFGEQIAMQVPIIYGGSVKSNNAQELFAQADIDGGLIGGASLDAESFVAITEAFE